MHNDDAAQAARVVLAKGKARLFWSGNPIVFGGAVESVQPGRSGGAAPKTGDAVVVTDHAGAPLVRTQHTDTQIQHVQHAANVAWLQTL